MYDVHAVDRKCVPSQIAWQISPHLAFAICNNIKPALQHKGLLQRKLRVIRLCKDTNVKLKLCT